MGFFRKKNSYIPENDSLIEDIYEKISEKELADLEKEAELADAYELMRRRAKRRKLFVGTATVLLLLTLTLGVVYVGYKMLFRITSIEIKGESPYLAEEIRAAIGVEIGDGLYSFSSRTAAERLSLALTGISELTVERQIPNRITFTVKYEEAVYYTEIYGKIYLMSESLRVLSEGTESDRESLIWLRLTGVKEVRFGSVPVLRDSGTQKRLSTVTAITEESVMADRIDQIDLRSSFDLKMVADGKYLLEMGDYTEIDTKLKIAEAVLFDEMFQNDNKARLDLSKLTETPVLIDNKLDFTK